MGESSASQLDRRISRLRWQAPLLAFVLVLLHQLMEHTVLISLPRWQHFATQLVFYGAVGPILAWWALTSIRRSVLETQHAEQALKAAHAELSEANERLEFLIRINRRLAEAEDEDSLIQVILALPGEVVPAVGCTLIRFDRRQQPLPAIHSGELEPDLFDAWAAHLSAPNIRQACAHCDSRWAISSASCPNLKFAADRIGISKIFCLEISRGEHRFGILNIYLSDADRPDPHERVMLYSMADEIALAMESLQLRSRELATLFHLQQTRRLTNLNSELAGIVEQLLEALTVDGGVIYLVIPDSGDLQSAAKAGVHLDDASGLIEGLAMSALQSDAPFLIGDLERARSTDDPLRSVLVAPLRDEERHLGALILWSLKPHSFSRRHLRFVSAIAGQAALLIENYWLYLRAEHEVALAERSRLAREIHDGLAQTLGYLQLRMAQILTWMDEGSVGRARVALVDIDKLVRQAYTDAREAIDGLLIRPGEAGMQKWLEQTIDGFRNLSEISIEVSSAPPTDIPPAVQVQMLRIVQEALGNIRKHSQATHAQLDWQLDDHSLTLHISDNGRGFDPEDVPPIACHGLRSMRERAELLDAEFQIISSQGAGTEVVVRFPLPGRSVPFYEHG